MEKRFKDLAIGEEFDWINDEKPGYNSFFLRCWRNSLTKREGIDNEQVSNRNSITWDDAK